ncbi:hypothetical protein [Thiothrix fructosivorans]|uniref:Uncharacterized protein n=1 Tax=Thiothrix fructosivorans TaxID=111770 RepID=A0A8B0STN7_9GAMM|nr:hypothetical protein [Thiothrix fructosivorans]MBO0611381.1 hypothetical protein [Thiothrix fructosivorans]QTX13047.1 hypothetical protein J1836_020310 [Thiothrix fructosivorans]
MTLTANDKRASMPRACDYTKTFHKDWQRLTRSGRYNMKLLKEVMLLLIYRLEQQGKQEMIVFVRAGTHAELFE